MRLIDVEALRAWLKTIPLTDLSDGKGLCRVIMEHDFAEAIKNMPKECIVDAEPVRHGRWIKYSVDIAEHPYHCSACGYSDHHVRQSTIRDFNYCPNCGAKMDEATE